MTTCEYCGRTLRQDDPIHGIKYGRLTTTGFKAAQESAVVVICEPCGNLIYQIVYNYLDQGKLKFPAIFKMYLELKTSMGNGDKMIQSIAKLPRESQVALQLLITACSKEG